MCDAGWSGSKCGVVLLQPVGTNCVSATAVVDVNGTCCDGAIDSVTGACCGAGGAVDGDGRCCAAGVHVDACGVCGGDGVVMDVSGVCCSHALAPSGLCCDGSLDSCGVCDGTNDCEAEVSFSIPAGTNLSTPDIAAAIGAPSAAVVIVSIAPSGGVGSSTVGASADPVATHWAVVTVTLMLIGLWSPAECCAWGTDTFVQGASVVSISRNSRVGDSQISIGILKQYSTAASIRRIPGSEGCHLEACAFIGVLTRTSSELVLPVVCARCGG